MRKRNMILALALASVSTGSLFATATNKNQVISIEKAKAIAASKVPGGTVTSIELDRELRGPVYEIEIHLGKYEYDLKLNAITGSGISVRKEYRDDSMDKVVTGTTSNQKPQQETKPSGSTTIAPKPGTKLTTSEAKAIALQQVPNATIKKIELDEEDGRLVYEIELRKQYIEYDVEIDAITGTVLKCEADD